MERNVKKSSLMIIIFIFIQKFIQGLLEYGINIGELIYGSKDPWFGFL